MLRRLSPQEAVRLPKIVALRQAISWYSQKSERAIVPPLYPDGLAHGGCQKKSAANKTSKTRTGT